jgi:multiple sugar transport system substrate-binding protein
MRTMNKFLVGLLTIVMVLSAVGCGAKTTGPVTLHILTQDQAGMKPAEIDQIARDFEAQNPNIKIVMEYVGYDYIHDKIVTAMGATPPGYDASMIDVIWPDEFIKAGYLLDVTSRITADMKSGIFPASWNGVTRNGKVYGMPWLMDQKYFMYNKDMLTKAGIANPPATWEDLRHAMVDGCEILHVQQSHPAEGWHQRASHHLGGTGGSGQDHQGKRPV